MQELTFSRKTVEPTSTPAVVDRNRALLEQGDGYIYKNAGASELAAYVFPPRTGKRPAAGWPVGLFFFSSAWDSGQVSQFAPHALYFASRGMAGVLVDYRVASRHPRATPLDAMSDARSAVRWTRAHAAELGVDPARVLGCGGSGGAHAIMSAALLRDGDDPADDVTISCVPDALIVFSPFLDTSNDGIGASRFPDKRTARRANLMRHVRRRLPPVLILHGASDRVVPIENSRRYVRKNRWRRNVCRLCAYEGHGHGFFNFNVDARLYELTLHEMDTFLTARGFLEPHPDDGGVLRLS